jgi:hypothetical protein
MLENLESNMSKIPEKLEENKVLLKNGDDIMKKNLKKL